MRNRGSWEVRGFPVRFPPGVVVGSQRRSCVDMFLVLLMGKKKIASSGLGDASVLRRSSRETSSRKQAVSSSVSSRKAKRIEKRTSPSSSPVKNKLEKIEKQMRSNPVRMSDRGKQLVDIPSISSTKEKTEKNSKHCAVDVNEDKKTDQDPNVGSKKRKRLTAIRYKASFKPQRLRIESDVDKELKSQNSLRVQITPDSDGDHNVGNLIDLDHTEHGDCSETKSLVRKSIESGDVDKQIGGIVSLSNRDIENCDNYMFHTSSCRIEHDLDNHKELDTCHKEDASRKSKDVFEKIKREWDEKRANLKNEYKLDECFIHAIYHNPSIRSEKLKTLQKEFANDMEELERLWGIRFEDLKATMLQAESQVAADNDASLHGSHTGSPEVALILPGNPIEMQIHDKFGSHTYEKEVADATVSSEPFGEGPALQLDDDMEVDVAEKVEFSRVNAKAGTGSSDASHAVEGNNETSVFDMAPHVDSGDKKMPADNKENDDDTIGLYKSHLPKDYHDVVDDVAPEVESAETGMPAGTHVVKDPVEDHIMTCAKDMVPDVKSGDTEMLDGDYDKENDEDGSIGLNTSHIIEDCHETVDDVAPEIEYAKMEMPAGACNKEKPDVGDVLPHDESAEIATRADKEAEDCIIRPDALHASEDHNDFCGHNSFNPVCATISQDKTPSVVQPVSDHLEPIIPEIQNEPLQLEQLSGVTQLFVSDNSSTNPTVADSPSDMLSPSKPLLGSFCEETTLTMPQSDGNLEENPAAAETPHEEHQPRLATSVAPIPPVNSLNMFDNLVNEFISQMPSQTNPLQAEVERLYTVKDNVTKFHQQMKQRLNSECEKEIAEIVAQIRLKFEAKHQETDAAYNIKKIELETNINKVIMNNELADAFRSKCQDLNPSGHPASQAEIMRQLGMLCVPSGQSSSLNFKPSQQQPRMPLQMVNQPTAHFSSSLAPLNTTIYIYPLNTGRSPNWYCRIG
ncbi:hypothetical protein R6Q59_024345 [Mikania micrantha]